MNRSIEFNDLKMEFIFGHNYHLDRINSNQFSVDFSTLIAYGFRLVNSSFNINSGPTAINHPIYREIAKEQKAGSNKFSLI